MAPTMSEAQKKFYLTTPIYYVNARPHIGHAYTTIAADVIARRHRLLGDDTFFLTGTDEHGQKIERSATAAGIPPQQFADQVSAQFESLWKRMGITNDDYIRTTESRHKRGVQKLFQLLRNRNKIYLSTYTGQYSVGEEMFIDGPPGTIGPDGKPTETVTEENYFFRLSEYQLPLIDLIESGELNIQPEVRKNEVLSFLRGNVTAVQASEVGAPGLDSKTWDGAPQNSPRPTLAYSAKGTPYVPGALKDLSISRSSFKWGIPVPGDPKTEKDHVIYVWLDALANYMTAIGYGSDDPADQAKFEKYWPADLHLVGKEIIRFHCVYWPAFLLAADLPLPKAITAHGWLLFEESKMSKSRGNIVRTETILDAFGTLCPLSPSFLSSRSAAEESASPEPPQPPAKAEQDLFAADVIRYFLLREIPFGQDGSFSFDALVQRYNSDLANGYGNLVSRTVSLIGQSFDGTIPAHPEWDTCTIQIVDKQPRGFQVGLPTGFVTVADTELARLSAVTVHFYNDGIAHLRFSQGRDAEQLKKSLSDREAISKEEFGAIDSVFLLIQQTDSFISANTPWKLAKSTSETDRAMLGDILYQATESIRIITALLYPILPYATAKVWAQLGLGDIEEAAAKGELKNLQWGGLKPDTKLGPLSPIFPRADKGLIQIMTDMEQNNAPIPSKLVDEKTTHTEPIAQDSTHPAAPPRTSTIDEHNPGDKVGGSHAVTTERQTQSHTEATASGIFANAAAGSSIPDTPQIAIDDFVKIDLRVARILVAERIPKADKLLRLEVDLGYEKRQILSGIAEWYTPEELIGRNIVVIANLAPRKMRGLESHGMLLAASHGEGGKPILATFAEDIALGSRLR
jgi:methionyl-tRNA synthetase